MKPTIPSSWSSASLLSSAAPGPFPNPPTLTPELVEAYESLLQTLLQPGDEGLEATVEKNLDSCDYFFMGWVAEKASKTAAPVSMSAYHYLYHRMCRVH